MPPKKFVKNIKAMKQAIEAQKKVGKWAVEVIESEECKDIVKNIRDKYHFDCREFGTIVAFFHGYDNKEKFVNDLKTELNNMSNDFYKTMDRFLDQFESYDFGSLKTDNLKNCKETVLISHLIQLPGNIVNGCQEYNAYRHSSVEKQKQNDSFTMATTGLLTNMVDTISYETGVNVNNSNSKMLDELSPLAQEQNDITTDPTLTRDYDMGKSDSYHITAPDFLYYFDKLNEDKNSVDKDIQEKYRDAIGGSNALSVSIIEFRFDNVDSFSRRNTTNNLSTKNYNIFIDGKCLNQLLTKNEGEKQLDFALRQEVYLAKAVKEGKPIEIAKTYVEDGKANTEIIPLKFSWSDNLKKKFQEEKVEREHSWFRLTFFDWGPFKIKRDPKIMNEVLGYDLDAKDKENDANKKQRHQEIISYRNGEFLTKVNELRVNSKKEPLEPGTQMFSKYELKHQKGNNIQKDDRIQLDIANEEFISKQEEQKVNNNEQKNVELENNLEVNNKEIQS